MSKEGHSHKHFENLKVERLPDSEAVVTGELTLELIEELRPEALRTLGETAKIDGFRPGAVPESVLVNKVGDMRILEETAELALAREYGAILRELKLSPVGRPRASITKLAPGIPLEFRLALTLEPEFTLPDYKTIAAGIARGEESTVSDEEIEAVIKEIEEHKWEPKLKEGEDLKSKVRGNLLEEKKHREAEKRRLAIVESIVKATDVSIPKALAESELDRMVSQFRHDVEGMGKGWDEYLKSIKKTEDDIRGEWAEKARERVKAELIMQKIAEAEKLEPSTEELERESAHILSHHKDADPLRVRLYVYQTMKNMKVLEFLENVK